MRSIVLLLLLAVNRDGFCQEKGGNAELQVKPFRCEYGTLIFEGILERRTGGQSYQFTVKKPVMKYNAQGKSNRVDVIKSGSLSFYGSRKNPDDATKRTLLFEEKAAIDLTLSQSSATATLPEFQFHVLKESFDQSDLVGFSVSDGRVVWPLRLRDATPDVEHYELKGEDGTLVYEGTIERLGVGDNFEYSLKKLTLTFNPRGKTNKTSRIDAKTIALATAAPASSNGRSTSAKGFQDSKPISVSMNVKSPTAVLEDLKFTVPRSEVIDTRPLTLQISNGKLVWNIPLQPTVKPVTR